MTDKPIPLHPYNPVPWETFTLIETPPSPDYGRTRAPMTAYVFGWLCVLAVIGGVLWALNN